MEGREENCPVCGGPAVARCRCPLGDSYCEKRHRWFYCPVHRTKLTGESTHADGNTFACRCPKEDGREPGLSGK